MQYNGSSVARLRVDVGLTQAAAARLIGKRMPRRSLSARYLGHVERGRERPSAALRRAMALVYKVTYTAITKALSRERKAFLSGLREAEREG